MGEGSLSLFVKDGGCPWGAPTRDRLSAPAPATLLEAEPSPGGLLAASFPRGPSLCAPSPPKLDLVRTR